MFNKTKYGLFVAFLFVMQVIAVANSFESYKNLKITQEQKTQILEKYQRPAFDKSTYKGTVWSAANPWFRPSLNSVSRTNTYGGPDFAWHNFLNDDVLMWKSVAERYHKYGITGLQMEMVNKAGNIGTFQKVAEGFKQSNNKMKVMPFLSVTSSTPEKMIDNIGGTLEAISSLIQDNESALYKLNGAPVIMIYSPTKLDSDNWKLVFHFLEKKYGRIIWLFNAAHHFHSHPDKLRKYLEAFDGISMYGNWGTKGQRELFKIIAPIMHKEFPQKIFEGAVHTNYTVHFHYGGMIPELTRKYRDSWEITISAKPDSITVTNWFDIYENSRIMPSYELEDVRLRFVKYFSAIWKKQKIRKWHVPDLYIANFTNAMLGQMIKVELIAFPTVGGKLTDVQLELCRPDGTVLYCSPKTTVKVGKLNTKLFKVSSMKFVNEKALLPRIRYKWLNRNITTPLMPQTNLVTSLRPHLLYWCRSINNLLSMQIPENSKGWQIDNVSSGEVFTLPSSGLAVFNGVGRSLSRKGVSYSGGNWVRILRNGRELKSFKTLSPWGLNLSLPMQLPSPIGALDWYNLELENYKTGSRYITPPIWVVSGKRPGGITMPIWDMTSEQPVVKEVKVEAVRVPFFYYECKLPCGNTLLDSSGYFHNGVLGNKKVKAAHLSKTLYRHEHVGPAIRLGNTAKIGTVDYPKYQKDSRGSYLQFDGNSYAMLRGGTAFPYAATYELFIKPERDNAEETLLATVYGQIQIKRLKDGRIEASRSGAIKLGSKSKKVDSIISQNACPKGKWTHIATVYDLKYLYLYINGNLEGKIASLPLASAEMMGSVVLAGGCKFPFYGVPSFKGGIRKVRIYGRNLAPKELLCNIK